MDLVGRLTAFAQQALPPLAVRESSAAGSFGDAAVELLDRHVLWRFILERSILTLVACQEFDQRIWWDSDLLERLHGQSVAWRRDAVPSVEQMRTRMAQPLALDGIVDELETLREAVAVAFSPSRWQTTRSQLLALGRQRDAELFGRSDRTQS